MQLQNKFKIRCSAIGQIMTEPQTKSPMQKYLEKMEQINTGQIKYDETKNKETKTAIALFENLNKWRSEVSELETNKDKIHLSQTCLTYVHEWVKSQPEFYNRQTNFNSKYTLKGMLCENESIEFAAQYYGWGKVAKNEEFKENEYLTGTADIILPGSVEDIKNSWSQKSFPLFINEIPVDGYGWQLQGYCELYDKPQAGLVYTLMDAPEIMVDKEANYKRIELGLEEYDFEMWQEIKDNMTYSNVREDLRIKRYFLDRDKSAIERVYERVETIRKYIEQL